MGLHVIHMPDLGEGIAEVEVVAWRVQPGDVVLEDQVLADVMTDKATVEIPSPVAGSVVALGGAPGQALAVGAELIRIEVAGVGNLAAPAQPPAPEPVAGPVSTPVSESVSAAVAASLAAPAVRQRAAALGVALSDLHGSGPGGRISHADLDAWLTQQRQPPGQTGASASADSRYAEATGEHTTPLIGLRRKIAANMQEAKRRIPHFTYVEEVDVTELEALRLLLNQRYAGSRAKLTLLPFIVRALVLAVGQTPAVNARFDDDANTITSGAAVHVGIATQTEAGLMVPVLRHAEACDPWRLATEIDRLATAARNGRALREELRGSTITVTSLGALGGIVSTPVLNRPEVAILGVNRIVERPVVHSGNIVVRKMMNLSSSFDHRVIDGMVAARFIQHVRSTLESPALLFVA